MVDAKTEGWIEIAQRGFENWKAKPHNARWFRKIDGTPIPNDLTICIGEAFAEPLRSLSLRVEAEKRAREEVERELSEERLWSSRYCVEDYEVRNAIGERFCLVPPDGGDVKTWEAAAEMRKTLEAAETHSAALARALEDVSAKVDAFWNDPERPSVHRMRSKSVHELSDAQRRARSLLAPKEDTDAE